MTVKKSDDQLLRKVFDAAYEEIDHLQNIDTDALKTKLERSARNNRRIIGLSAAVMAVAVLVIAGIFALDAYIDYLAWQNRPSFAERLVAPYDLDKKWPPYLLNAVTVDAQVDGLITFNTANIEYYPASDRPDATQLNATVVKLQSIVPATIGNYTLQWDRQQSTLLAKCLVSTATAESDRCQAQHTAEFIEFANFVNSDGEQIGLVMTKFANAEQAASVMQSTYQYARRTGRIGNFALTNMVDVDYFYSATRAAGSFTWLNSNWVISVSAESFDTVDEFLPQFPLYENNPNLAQIVVEQIAPTVPEPVVEEPVEVPAEEVPADAVTETENTETVTD